DLEKNLRVNHLWVVPMGSGREADSSAALRNDNQGALRNDNQGAVRNDNQSGLRNDNQSGLRNDNQSALRNDRQRGKGERQITFWKEGESGGRFSPDGKQVLFISEDGGTSSQIYLASWNDAQGTLGTPK